MPEDETNGGEASEASEEAEARSGDEQAPSADAFYAAYTRVSAQLYPVTGRTLRDTDPGDPRIPDSSPPNMANRWSGCMTRFLLGVLLAIIGIEIGQEILRKWFPLDDPDDPALLFTAHVVWDALLVILPFLYGWLGSMVRLVRASTYFHRARTFDRDRRREYYQRMALGAVAGGIILMLIDVDAVTTGEFHIAAVAVAFVAGYEVRVLFEAIERLVLAIFPKDEKQDGKDQVSPGRAPH